jgi:hypothetical protein
VRHSFSVSSTPFDDVLEKNRRSTVKNDRQLDVASIRAYCLPIKALLTLWQKLSDFPRLNYILLPILGKLVTGNFKSLQCTVQGVQQLYAVLFLWSPAGDQLIREC